MRTPSFFIAVYSLFLLVGGAIGYFVAGSLPSLVMSAAFAIPLIICSALTSRGSALAHLIALGLSAVLFLFFGYRFLTTLKLFPAGVMALISCALVIYLAMTRVATKRD